MICSSVGEFLLSISLRFITFSSEYHNSLFLDHFFLRFKYNIWISSISIKFIQEITFHSIVAQYDESVFCSMNIPYFVLWTSFVIWIEYTNYSIQFQPSAVEDGLQETFSRSTNGAAEMDAKELMNALNELMIKGNMSHWIGLSFSVSQNC